MKDINTAEIEELKHGFARDENGYQCLHCDERFEDGFIYTMGGGLGALVDAHKAAALHVEEAHGSPFAALGELGHKHTGLTSAQAALLQSLYEGESDKQISAETGTAQSTVRYRRYNLREKAHQARIFLAQFELVEQRIKNGGDEPHIHEGATMVDERYMITAEERDKVLKTYFTDGNPPTLKAFPPKEKKKLVILEVFAERFERGRTYTQKEVTDTIFEMYRDPVEVRRFLISYGFMDREKDGSAYWRK